ncbi:nickel ABC transporter, permease subunit NikB [compost metagenome]
MIVFRYLSREVLVTLSAVSAVLLVIIMSGRFIKYLAQAAQGILDPGVLFLIMGYRLPGFLQLILPLGLFLGILLAYGRLYLESEMTVLSTTGMSQQRLFRMTLFPATLELAFAALLFAGVVGLLAGVIAALKRGSLFDHGVMGISLAGYSMPIFWWGLILIMFFSGSLGWTPVSGRIDLLYDIEPKTGFMLIDTLLSDEEGAFKDALMHLILPAIVLGTIPLAVIARMTRSAMLEVLREDYVRTARAKGLSPARVVFVHGLRNALIPVLTVVGLQVGTLLAGAVLTETIFSWPGIGKWLIEAIGARDYPVVQNGILLIACLVILVNFVVDILYGFANPRIRHQR